MNTATFAFAIAFAASGITTIRVAFDVLPQLTDDSRLKGDRLCLALQALGMVVLGALSVLGAGMLMSEQVRSN